MAYISNLGMAFYKVVLENPDGTALLYPSTGLNTSYKDLFDISEKIALNLISLGVKQNQLVGIFHDKSPHAFGLILACLRLGIPYSIFDPDSPFERLHKIWSNCRPSIIVRTSSKISDLEQILKKVENLKFIDLDCLVEKMSSSSLPAFESQLPPIGEIIGSAAAYVMFTSGSTGTPKGAAISHENLLRFINWAKNVFEITQNDVMSNLNPMHFDNSVFDFYASIFNGATLIPVSKNEIQTPHKTIEILELGKCTIWFSVPSLLIYYLKVRAIDGRCLKKITKFIFGGEGFPVEKLKTFFNMYNPTALLINVYGPTECTCICSAHIIKRQDLEGELSLPPLGKLAQNFLGKILPLDHSDNCDNYGELFLMGPQVGLGYYNDPERTRQSFLQNPDHNAYTEIGYLTGDIVLKDSQGMLHFKGRVDNQIKHLGYRIELEEIEGALFSFPGIDEVTVIYKQLPQGFGHIIGFIATSILLEEKSLRVYCQKRLPSYMIPHKFILMANLPKNPNGKIDRISLLKYEY